MQQASADNQSALKWQEALENEVSGLVSDPAQRVFAVFDGAVLDNPAYEFGKRQLFARPLFSGNTPQDFVSSGPWLIDLYHLPPRNGDDPAELIASDPAIQARSLIKLAAAKPALVFWVGGPELTHERMFKHLRSINKVLIPKEDGEPGEQEAVIFRHADGNVLASVLPVLDEAQFVRLFGPALALTFHAPDFPDEDGWPVRRAVQPDPVEQTPPGMLALRPDQMRRVEAALLARSKRRITKYLKIVAPEHTRQISEAQLAGNTTKWVHEARALGVQTEAGLGRWCYLQMISSGYLSKNEQVLNVMHSNELPLSPDEKVKLLLRGARDKILSKRP